VLTVLNWYSARRGRKALHELVAALLTDKPTLVALVGDHYTAESHLRPWVPLAEKFADRLEVILAAEWEEPDRARDGQVLWRTLGVAPEAWPRLFAHHGDVRTAVLLRGRRPWALVDVFFLEKGYPYNATTVDPREPLVRAREVALFSEIERLLGRLPPPDPPPRRILQPGEHDFSPTGVCHACGDGRASLRSCPGSKKPDEPRRDRFELIEIE
jgi:hypothetical protein